MTSILDALILAAWDLYDSQAPDMPSGILRGLVMADTGANAAEVAAALERDRQRSRAERRAMAAGCLGQPCDLRLNQDFEPLLEPSLPSGLGGIVGV